MEQLVPWLWILAIVVVLWLLMIRPAQRRQAATAAMQKAVEVGDQIVLTSGIYGTVNELTDDAVVVEVAEGVELRVMRGAIGSKVHTEPDSDDIDDSDDMATEADDDTDTTGAERADGED